MTPVRSVRRARLPGEPGAGSDRQGWRCGHRRACASIEGVRPATTIALVVLLAAIFLAAVVQFVFIIPH